MTLEARPDNAHPRTIFSVNHAPNPQRVGILQSLRAGAVRKSLVADLAREPEDRIAAHRIRAAIRSRGMGSAMHHGVAHFDSGREPVERKASHLAFENRN